MACCRPTLFENDNPQTLLSGLQKGWSKSKKYCQCCTCVGTKVYIITTVHIWTILPFMMLVSQSRREDIQSYTQESVAKTWKTKKINRTWKILWKHYPMKPIIFCLLSTGNRTGETKYANWEVRNKAVVGYFAKTFTSCICRCCPVYLSKRFLYKKSLYPYFKKSSRQGMNVFRQLYGIKEHLNPKDWCCFTRFCANDNGKLVGKLVITENAMCWMRWLLYRSHHL